MITSVGRPSGTFGTPTTVGFPILNKDWPGTSYNYLVRMDHLPPGDHHQAVTRQFRDEVLSLISPVRSNQSPLTASQKELRELASDKDLGDLLTLIEQL